MSKKKVIVIGLDGSSWDLVKPLIKEGLLPNMQRIIEQGTHAMMESTHPAHSAPAWTTFATGVEPTDHGCLDFLTVNKDIDDLTIIDSTKIPQETIYENMVKHGRTPILVNLPNTFPPRLKNNTTITSLMTRGDKYIFPESLKEKYSELQKYRLNPNPKLRLKDNFDPYVKDLCVLEEERIAGVKQLFLNEPWDFFFYLCSGTDWVSHVVYDKALYERYEPAIRMWKIMDDFIGWLTEHMDKDTNLFVMSDHGFKVYNHIFFINRWLEENDYLTTKSGQGSFQKDHNRLSKEIAKEQNKQAQLKIGKNLRSILGKSKIIERVAKFVYFKFVKRFLPVNVSIDLQLDLPKTQVAFPRGSMATMLYINDKQRFTKGSVSEAERAPLAQTLKEQLLQLKDPTGEPVLKNVFLTEELYGKPGIETSPDLFLEADKYYLSGSLHSSSLFEKTTKNYHDGRGMFIAYGPDIKKATQEFSTNIRHMAPTIMQALQLPMQQQFAGTPMNIFTDNSVLSTTVVTTSKISSERDEIASLVDNLDI